jgi:hypothetical protein
MVNPSLEKQPDGFAEQLSTERFSLHGQATALGICQPGAPAAELLLENPIFLFQIVQDLLLVAVQPVRDRKDYETEWGDCVRHGEGMLPATG